MTLTLAKWESGHPASGLRKSWREGGGVAEPSGKSNAALTWHLLSAAGPVICSREMQTMMLGRAKGILVDPQMPPSSRLSGGLSAAASQGRLEGASLTGSAEARTRGLGHGALGSFLSQTS